MTKQSKRVKELKKLLEPGKIYSLDEAIEVLQKIPKPKFDESVDINIKLDLDAKSTSQAIRGTVALPHGSGKKVKVAVFCKGEAEKFAKEAGADFVGADELVAKVSKGWTDFDVAVSTPDMMKDVGKLGKVLGPKGLMPNPKSGTVTTDVAKAIKEVKAGRVEFRMDKQGNISTSVGKVSFDKKALSENATAMMKAILAVRPASVKGHYIKNASISSTMGPGLKLDLSSIRT